MKANCLSKLVVMYFLLLFSFVDAHAFDVEFIDMTLKDAVFHVSRITNKNITLLGGEERITWIQKDLDNEKMFQEFERVIEEYGYTSISEGEHLSIRKITGTVNEKALSIYRPKWIDLSSIANDLQTMWQSQVTIVANKDVIFVSGKTKSVKIIEKILTENDKPLRSEFTSIKLKHIPLKSFVTLLEKNEKLNLICVPDYWTNSIIIKGKGIDVVYLKNLVATVDIERDDTRDSLVIYLNTDSAEILLPIIQQTYPSIELSMIDDKKLLAVGTTKLLNDLNRFVRSVDGAGVQVNVECVIASLSDTAFKELGIKLGMNNNNFNLSVNDSFKSLLLPNALLEFSNQTLEIGINANEYKSKSEIISQPNLTVMNGHEAEILVGQNVPIIASKKESDNDSSSDVVKIERQDIGVKLSITPVVQGNFIKLSISQEISSIDEQEKAATDIVTEIKSISSTVIAADGQTIYLGGVRSVDQTSYKEKVPFFGYIPILGNLFTYTNDKEVSRHLVISIRPKIVRPTT